MSSLTSKPRILLDTNVTRILKDMPEDGLVRWWRFVRGRFRYCVSPLVLAEILNSLRGDAEKHFQDVRAELRVLHGRTDPTTLPLPGAFVAKQLYAVDRENEKASTEVMAKVLRTAMRATDVVDVEGRKCLAGSGSTAVVLAHMIDPISEGQASMARALARAAEKHRIARERGQGRGADLSSSEEWAAAILSDIAVDDSAANRQLLAQACRAAYAYQRFLWTQTIDRYNPAKHPGDFMDQQLLLYLADPSLVIVSDETRMPKQIAGSGQEDRLWSFDRVWHEVQTTGSVAADSGGMQPPGQKGHETAKSPHEPAGAEQT